MDKITITLDGHSGCGKSTLAKSIAQELNYVYVDSGAMYRAITYYFTTKNLIENDVLVEGWESSIENVDLTFEKHTDYSNDVIFLNDSITTMEFVVRVLKQIFGKNQEQAENITRRIHDDGQGIVGSYVHEVAEQKGIETTLLARQENFPLQVKVKKQ